MAAADALGPSLSLSWVLLDVLDVDFFPSSVKLISFFHALMLFVVLVFLHLGTKAVLTDSVVGHSPRSS